MFGLGGLPAGLTPSLGVADAAVAVGGVGEHVGAGGLCFVAGYHGFAAALAVVWWGVTRRGDLGGGDTGDGGESIRGALVAFAVHPGLDDAGGGGAVLLVHGVAHRQGGSGARCD